MSELLIQSLFPYFSFRIMNVSLMVASGEGEHGRVAEVWINVVNDKVTRATENTFKYVLISCGYN